MDGWMDGGKMMDRIRWIGMREIRYAEDYQRRDNGPGNHWKLEKKKKTLVYERLLQVQGLGLVVPSFDARVQRFQISPNIHIVDR
jgi:hypothetical protein